MNSPSTGCVICGSHTPQAGKLQSPTRVTTITKTDLLAFFVSSSLVSVPNRRQQKYTLFIDSNKGVSQLGA